MHSQNNTNSDLVWARMKYCPFWPALVIAQAPPIIGRIPANKMCVFFFGTKQYGLVDLDKVFLYTAHREKYIAKGRGSDFINAVKSLEDFMSDRVKYQSNAHPTLINNEIQIKKEQDIEKSLKIKIEKKTPNESGSCHGSSAPWLQEKKRLIEKIVALQTENQSITFDLQNKISHYKAIIGEKVNVEHQLSEKVMALTDKLNNTISEATVIKANLAKQKDQDKETIVQLTYENKTLEARLKQLQFGINQQNASKNDSEQKESSHNVYEVEKLIRHKKKKGVIYYLVRWKNFTPEDDTWEKEENLMCPGILKSYKRKMKL